jgi:hypothetical protein
MDYASWMKAQFAQGVSPNEIADSALQLPLASTDGSQDLLSLLQRLAMLLKINQARVHLVGSARYGFALGDGALFDPRFSNLNVAVIHNQLYHRCGGGTLQRGPRSPELELPLPQGIAFRRMVDDLSRMVLDKFAYVSIVVYPDREALIAAESAKISTYLGVRNDVLKTEPPMSSASFGEQVFDVAICSGLPRFLGKVSESPPDKASPYMTDELGFRQAFDTTPIRRQLLSALDQALSDIRCIVNLSCCLVGGSFVDPHRPDPRDIDMVIFYRALDQSKYDPAHALLHLSRKFKLRSIDTRFVPCDAEPWLVVKMASFFTSLYHSSRDQSNHQRGVVLLVPSERPQPSKQATGLQAKLVQS